MIDDPRESQMLSLLCREGPLSRQDLHERLRLRPNTVGDLAERLIALGVIRECQPQVSGPGRPRVPLEIDPGRRWVVGLALEPGEVSLSQLNLLGEACVPTVRRSAKALHIVETAAELLDSIDLEPVITIGVTAAGFIDAEAHELLLSSTTARARPMSFEALYRSAGGRRVRVENDLQALAVQWMLTHEAEARDDILLIHVRDGGVGAAVLVNGRPIRGCVMGGNELGHTRMPVDTARCYCGHVGCLERIVSTEFLRMHGPGNGPTLGQAVAAYQDGDEALEPILRYLSMAIGNAINLLRPRRVVLASEFNRHPAFTDRLLRDVRETMLGTIADRVRIDPWDRPNVDFAEAAAWLALASIYREEWLTTDAASLPREVFAAK